MAITVTRKLVSIDADVSVSELLESWKNGNKSHVINKLADDHPGLGVMFVVEGIRNKVINSGEVNSIVNQLIDKRVELLRASE